MKTYFFTLLIITLSLGAFAQKKLLIYNFSSYNVNVGLIQTKHTTNAYPNVNASPSILIPALGGSFELYTGHTTRFPFNAPDPLALPPYLIPTWGVQTAATTYMTMSANAVALVYGSDQVFHFIKYDDGSGSGTLGTSPMGTSPVMLTDTIGYYGEFLTGGIIEYTLVIVDN